MRKNWTIYNRKKLQGGMTILLIALEGKDVIKKHIKVVVSELIDSNIIKIFRGRDFMINNENQLNSVMELVNSHDSRLWAIDEDRISIY